MKLFTSVHDSSRVHVIQSTAQLHKVAPGEREREREKDERRGREKCQVPSLSECMHKNTYHIVFSGISCFFFLKCCMQSKASTIDLTFPLLA